MYTITLAKAIKRLDDIFEMMPSEEKFIAQEAEDGGYEKIEAHMALQELIELVYKSGKHDGWYDHIAILEKLKSKSSFKKSVKGVIRKASRAY